MTLCEEIRTPWASVQRWNASTVYVLCPFCAKTHAHGFCKSYSSTLRVPHCSGSTSLSYPCYRFRYPFSSTENTTEYEIDKSRGFYVALAAQTTESDLEALGNAFNTIKLNSDAAINSRRWKSAEELVTVGTEDEVFRHLYEYFGGEDTFTLKRLDHVVSRMLTFGDHKYVERYIRTSREAKIFLFGVDDEGNSALNLAACEKHSDIITLLLGNGADVDHQNTAGRSPLMEAAL